MSNRFVSLAAALILVAGCQSAPPANPPDGSTDAEVDKKSLALFNESLDAIHAEHYTDAEKLLKELTQRDPKLSGPWVNLGSVYAALGDDKAAEAAYKQAIEVNPDSCPAYVELGIMARRAGDFLTAEADYLACTQRVPDFREAYLNLGILYELYLGKLNDALKAYQTYQALSKDEDRRVAGWVADLERRLAGNAS
jgi:tetratricopeptide (TPR) repeat protein